MDTQVVIVGAGPVGLTLAVELGRRGVRCTLIERKERAAAPSQDGALQRPHHGNFPPHGAGRAVRAAGLPADVPMDVFIVTSLIEPPLLHLPYPSVAQAKQQIAARNDGTLPLEPYQLISQYTWSRCSSRWRTPIPMSTVRYGCEFVSFDAGRRASASVSR